jgi:AcrR family transcriptional regulator
VSTRAEQAQRTRQGVLDTARRLFAEKGYAATSLQQIADALGVTKANVYYYFRTKDAILEALLDERVAALDAVLDEAETIADRRRRRAVVVDGFVEQVVLAHRTIAAVDVGDPGIRGRPKVAERLDALSLRFLRVLFGERPTVDEQAGYWMVNDLSPVTRRLTHLPDDELRALLRRLCLRLLPD